MRNSNIQGDLSAADGGAANFFMLSKATLRELSMRSKAGLDFGWAMYDAAHPGAEVQGASVGEEDES